MKAKAFKAQKRRVMRFVHKWMAPLGLKWWRIDFTWTDGELASERKPELSCIFRVCTDWEYGRADILASLPAIKRSSDEDLEEYVVHELCHVLIAELAQNGAKEDGQDHEERVVTNLTRAFQWLYQMTRDGEV